MNKQYAKGQRFERRVKDYLDSLGFLVTKSGKSKIPDLIAIPPKASPQVMKLFADNLVSPIIYDSLLDGIPMVIECKAYEKPCLTKLEKDTYEKFRKFHRVMTVLACKEGSEPTFKKL